MSLLYGPAPRIRIIPLRLPSGVAPVTPATPAMGIRRRRPARQEAAAERPAPAALDYVARARRAALHEAGHALVAVAMGCRVNCASIVPDDATLGHVDFTAREAAIVRGERFGDRFSTSEVRRRAAVMIAGAVAERGARPIPLEEIAASEVAEARNLLALIAHNQSADSLLREITVEVAGLLERRRGHLEALTRALLDRRTLSGAAVLEIVGGAA